VDTGRFNYRSLFQIVNLDENLHVDCTDVIVYDGDVYIQVLKDGTFYLDNQNKSKTLSDIEKVLWAKINSI
jgi:hypothetical protein